MQAIARVLLLTWEIMNQRPSIGEIEQTPLQDYLVELQIAGLDFHQTSLTSTARNGRVARFGA